MKTLINYSSLSILIQLFFSFNPYLYAQELEWAVSTSGIDLGYRYAAIDTKNNIIVGGEMSITQNQYGFENQAILNSNGEGINLRNRGYADLVLSYNSKGIINWILQYDSEFNQLVGISHQDTTTVILIMIEEYDTNEEGFPIGYISDLCGDIPIKFGLNLFFLDSNGKYIKHKTLFERGHTDINVTELLAYPKGGFVLTANVDDGLISPGFQEAGDGGADMLLKIDQNGNIDWMKLISNHNNSCCTTFEGLPKLAITKKGNIYLAGKYQYGATFNSENQIAAATFPGQGQHNVPFESYLASYTASGELNWVKTTKQRGNVKGIAANEKSILLGLELIEKNKLFDIMVDTSERATDYLVQFNNNGKIEWINKNLYGSVYNIYPHPEKGFLISGYPNSEHKRIFGKANFYIARCNMKNDYSSLFHSELYVKDEEDAPKLLFDHFGSSYLIGEVHYGLPKNLNEISGKFYGANAYGSAPFVLKFKYE